MNHAILVAALAEDRRRRCSCGAVTQKAQQHVPRMPGSRGLTTRDRTVEPSHRFTLGTCPSRQGSTLRMGGVAASDHRQGS
jgi:hypothetical protein